MIATVRSKWRLGAAPPSPPHAGSDHEPPVVGHTHVVALDEDPTARGQGQELAFGDRAGEFDARDQGEAPSHPIALTGHHGIFEIDGGPFDVDHDVTLAELVIAQRDDLRCDDLAHLGELVGRHGIVSP